MTRMICIEDPTTRMMNDRELPHPGVKKVEHVYRYRITLGVFLLASDDFKGTIENIDFSAQGR